MSPSERVALIFGPTDISAWAATRELLRYPTPTTFSFKASRSNQLLDPAVILSDPCLESAHGVNLTRPVEDVVKLLKERFRMLERSRTSSSTPTYTSRTMAANGQILDTTLRALEETSPNLWSFIW
ncbi:hypothetical protein PENSPDRAFT_661408 [Peniophora sp. CONT]|nr:hypothetical protein PENSPDRAFT_661408 [Peniophora sp. CONT]